MWRTRASPAVASPCAARQTNGRSSDSFMVADSETIKCNLSGNHRVGQGICRFVFVLERGSQRLQTRAAQKRLGDRLRSNQANCFSGSRSWRWARLGDEEIESRP